MSNKFEINSNKSKEKFTNTNSREKEEKNLLLKFRDQIKANLFKRLDQI